MLHREQDDAEARVKPTFGEAKRVRNEFIVKDYKPLPSIDDIAADLVGATGRLLVTMPYRFRVITLITTISFPRLPFNRLPQMWLLGAGRGPPPGLPEGPTSLIFADQCAMCIAEDRIGTPLPKPHMEKGRVNGMISVFHILACRECLLNVAQHRLEIGYELLQALLQMGAAANDNRWTEMTYGELLLRPHGTLTVMSMQYMRQQQLPWTYNKSAGLSVAENSAPRRAHEAAIAPVLPALLDG